MRVRPLRSSDIPILQSFVESSEVKYPDLTGERIEIVLVVVDADDQPIAAIAAERIIQGWFYLNPDLSPTVKWDALTLLHRDGIAHGRTIGYNSLEGWFTNPHAAKFARRMERTFGWIKNLPSWTLHF